MATLIRMPEIAANATHAVLIGWSVKEGDTVSVGDCLAEIETDKAVVELAAESDGVIGALLVAAGTNVPVGAPIAGLIGKGESKSDVSALLAQAADAAAAKPEFASAPQPTIPAFAPPTATSSVESKVLAADAAPGGRIFASPLARRLAKERGIDLAGVKGSGPNGRIVKRDIPNTAMLSQPLAVVQAATAADNHDVIPHTGMRKIIARRLTESKASIPHFYLNMECRMDALLALRKQINGTALRKISINDFIVKAAACALRDMPDMNVSWTDEAMHRYHNVDISVAVSTESGLITPIVRAAQEKTLSSISSTIASLAERARASKLMPNEYQGGAFCVSNLGMYGVSDFAAIINPPQAAILAVGATQKTPVVVEDVIQIASVMRCTLSVDHRAIDGALAAKWLAVFKGYIENPVAILV